MFFIFTARLCICKPYTCADQEVCQSEFNSTLTFFLFLLFMGGERIKIPLKGGHYWPASKTPLKWDFAGKLIMAQQSSQCWLGSFVIFQGIRTSTVKEPYSFVIFQVGVGSGPPVLPSGSVHDTSADHQADDNLS